MSGELGGLAVSLSKKGSLTGYTNRCRMRDNEKFKLRH